MTAETNKAVVRRFIDARNAWDLDALDDLVAPDCRPRSLSAAERPPGNPTGDGPEAWRRTLRLWQAGLPDSQVTVEEVIAEGDRVMQVEVLEGTHTGEILGGIAATEKRITLRGVRVYYLRDGQIAAYWNLWDWLGLYEQLGIVPPAAELLKEFLRSPS